MVKVTDKLDAHGLNVLQRAGTLPEVWIPPGELRDARDLPRTRMVLGKKLPLLPPPTRYVTEGLLRQIEVLDEGIEERMREVLLPTKEVRLFETLPGVEFILAVVTALE